MSVYCIDTGALIELQRHYFPATFKSLWINLNDLVIDGRLVAPVQVRDETKDREDFLSQWVGSHSMIFKPNTQPILDCVSQLMKRFQKYAFLEPLTGGLREPADPYVIALAMANDDPVDGPRYIVVTSEKMKGNQERIPFICQSVGVSCYGSS